MKQTAVEWLMNKLNLFNITKDITAAIEQAKEMEKQQIIDAWEDGQDSFSTRNAKQYYNETFNNYR